MQNNMVKRYAGLYCNNIEVKIKNLTITKRSYAKLILILIKQLVDVNFDSSYLTKSSQKPLYKTRYMLDELGNLQSEGHGIQGLATMLSIGLGQDQVFTLILQTLQQLRDVYGDSADKIIQGNTANIVFLKSTDDQMIDTLVKMSGTTHKVYQDSKTITRDINKLIFPTDGKVSYNMSAKEIPVISYNDFAFISPSNSIVFRAGDSPIWNRNETCLPMAYMLYKNKAKIPGKEFNLQTLPTTSQVMNFDIRKNQPDFMAMLQTRIEQAINAKSAKDIFKDGYEYSDYDISILDPDNYSDEVMRIINVLIDDYSYIEKQFSNYLSNGKSDSVLNKADQSTNEEVINETMKYKNEMEELNKKIYAKGRISKADLINMHGQINKSLEAEISKAYNNSKHSFTSDPNFMQSADKLTLRLTSNSKVLVEPVSSATNIEVLNNYMENNNIVNPEDISVNASFRITDEFFRYLSSLKSWADIADGKFESEFIKVYDSK